MPCAADNCSYMCRTCTKEFLDSKKAYFQEIAPNSTYSQKLYLKKIYICIVLDQLLHPYKFYDRDMSGILFSFLPVVSP